MITRGICSVCGRSIRLKVDGTLFHHLGESRNNWSAYRRPDCAGANQLPKPEDEE